MCSPQGIFDMCVCKAFDEAVKACKCVRQYRTNLEKLQIEMTSLECRTEIIERKVGEANERGEEVENDVLKWQIKAGRLKSDVEQLVQQSTDNENMHCFTRSCPNIKCRYRLSRQAEQKIADVMRLTQDSHFEEISHARPPPPELESCCNENYVNTDSRMEIFNCIVDALKDPNVNKIGIHGPGGVGKTTIVNEVGKKMQHDGFFKKIPLATVSKDLKVEDIQTKLAGCLNFKFEEEGEMARAKELWCRLNNGNKYLVILDDIWEQVNLNAIGIPIIGGNTGCKVLLTSRNNDLLWKTMRVDRNFLIPQLPDSEAWTLFKEKVGNSIESQLEINSLAEKVCKKCKGLPVAINALGGALEGQPEYAWKNALDNLDRYMLLNIEGIDPTVWASLRVSYDMLKSPDAKSCFLLCCLFAEDADISIDYLTRHCVARSLLCQNPHTFDKATNAVSTVISTLKSASLLLNGSNENVVRIHDVIRDVGIQIGREEENFLVDHGARQWPRNPINGSPYSAISLRSGKIKWLPDELTCPQLHTLMLDNGELSDLKVPDKFFSGMEQLIVLILTRLCMRLFPSSFANLTNLRMLYLNECELGDIAILGNLKSNLEVLSLGGSNIKVLPQEIGQLTNLRLLDIQNCRKLEVIPQGVIANLTSLEELYFPLEFDNWEALTDKQQDTSKSSNASLDELRRSLDSGQLTTLHILVPNAMLLPKEGLKFENLERFNIAVGSKFKYHYDEKRYLGSKMLKLEQIPLRKELMPLVNKAEVLYLVKLEGLKKVLHDRFGGNGSCNLKYLKVESCFDDWECLVPSHGLHTSCSLDKLTVLIIKNCNFKYLFSESTARGLIHLERLDISSCEIMEEIVRFEGQDDEGELTSKMKFNKLKKLELYNLPNLIRFSATKEKMGTTMGSSSTGTQPLFDEMVIFPVLERLTISAVGNITDIWDKQSIAVLQEQGSFCQLRSVNVSNYKRLTYVFPSNMHSLFKNLTSVNIVSCESMEGIILGFEEDQDEHGLENGVTFSKLSELRLQRLPNLISFCTKLGKEGTTGRSSSTNNARPLFDKKVIFPVLERLTINAVGNITDIWDKKSITVLQEQGSFCQLMDVHVSNCKRLCYVFPSNMHPLLKNLNELSISDCGSMEGIIVGFEGEQDEDELENGVTFSKLSELTLWYLPNLMSFSTKLDKAKTAERSSSPNYARPLFNKKVIFPVLESLSIYVVDNITEIWDKQSIAVLQEQGAFYQLRDVDVYKCKRLCYVFPFNMRPLLKNLNKLSIKDCGSMEGIIVGFEGEQDEDGLENGVTFRKLSELRLLDLPNLISFCTKLGKQGTTERSSSTNNARPLFDIKVIFPILERLTVGAVGNITEIWDKQSIAVLQEEGSFCQLMHVDVSNCKRLCYVFPSNMHPLLQNLTQLRIEQCGSMKGIIVGFEGEEDEDGLENGVTFSKLIHLTLLDLPNLISFSTKLDKAETTERSSSTNYARPLFNKKVIFPVLESLSIYVVDNITEIWDKQSIAVLQEQGAFYQLRDVYVYKCERLCYVFPSNMRPLLKNLNKLSIKDCGSMEGIIVGFEVEQDEDGLENGVTFSKLSQLTLWNLPNLISFSTKLDKAETTERSSSTNYARPLFNKKLAFPALETLSIGNAPNITEIWNKKSLPELKKETESFCKLKDITIESCEQLMYVFPSYMLPRLQNLHTFKIKHCEKMEVIVSRELKEKEAANNDVIVFPQLKNVALEGLDKLRSFCPGMQVFFSNKLPFPALETLYIGNAPNITEIWNKKSLPEPKKETESFCKLKDITVESCVQLVYVFPSYMFPRLQNLHTFKIKHCEKVEVIVSWELREKEATNNDVIVFPQLKNVALEGLDKLRSFCPGTQVFFSNKLAFPALETLYIGNAPNITEIWDKKSLPEPKKETESFCKLKDITVESCEQLVYVFPSYMFPRLQNLHTFKIKHCEKVEVIVSWKLMEKEAANKDVIVFPQLKNVALKGLDKLRSFCPGTQVLFSNKLAFPALETLYIGNAPNITEIWDKKSLPEPKKETESFCKLKDITVESCEQLVYVFPSYMFPRLQNLHTFKIKHCEKVEVIVSWKLMEKEAANKDVIVFPQLKNVALKGLDKLRSFCPGTQVLFSNKLAFPALETLYIGNAPNITEIWNKKSLPELKKETESFCKLKDITIESCEQLEYVFSSYMFPRLQNLHTFKIKHCEKVEVIVSWELKEKEVANNDVIVFPQLKNVALEGLDKLISFCPGTQVFFSNKVAFPTLEILFIGKAPNITEIWDKKSLPELEKKIESVYKLKDITVENCEELVYVLPNYMLPQLKTLQILKIKHCKKVEAIVSWELEEEATNNDVIVFPQLKNVELKGLDKVRSFYPGTQVFFSNKLAFPTLKTLKIGNVPNITKIWDKQQLPELEKETKSFCKLKDLTVENCEQLVYVFPFYMLPQLRDLQDLVIRNCKKLEVILSWEQKEKEAANNNVIVFSQLAYVQLEGLDKLTSFCSGSQVFFSNKLAFPALKILYIANAPNITEIWDEQQLSELEKESESFCKLNIITVKNCEQLVYVFPSNMLPQLQDLQILRIRDCKKLEVILSWEQKEKEAANNDVIVFSQLWYVDLKGLDKLTSFCSGSQVFFSNKVAFPALEWLEILNAPNIIEIWDKQQLPKPENKTKSFSKLRCIIVGGCEQLVYLFPSYMLPQLQINLQTLKVTDCKEMEVIVSREPKEKEAANNDVIVFFSRLKDLTLMALNKCTTFCSGMEVFFSNKDAFPALVRINLDGNLDSFRNETSTKKVLIEECGTSGKENDHNGEEG